MACSWEFLDKQNGDRQEKTERKNGEKNTENETTKVFTNTKRELGEEHCGDWAFSGSRLLGRRKTDQAVGCNTQLLIGYLFASTPPPQHTPSLNLRGRTRHEAPSSGLFGTETGFI